MVKQPVSVLLLSEPDYDEFALKYFLLYLNKIQDYYEFAFPEPRDESIFNFYSQDTYDTEELFSSFEQVRSKVGFDFGTAPVFFIVIINSRIDSAKANASDLFWDTRGNTAFITTRKWEGVFAPPSLFEYLMHCVIACLVQMNKKIHLDSHVEVRGCYLDYTYYKENDRVDIALGYVCDRCKTALSEVGPDYYSQLAHVLSRTWIGNIRDFGTVAFNLKNFFNFDIDKDSGFREPEKTRREKIIDWFYSVTNQAATSLVLIIVGAVAGGIAGYVLKGILG